MREYNTLSSFARRASRDLPGDRTMKADEFYKLALDWDCELNEAIGIRRTVMQAR